MRRHPGPGPWPAVLLLFLAACPGERGISARQPGDASHATDAPGRDVLVGDAAGADLAVNPDAASGPDAVLPDTAARDTSVGVDRAAGVDTTTGVDTAAGMDSAPRDSQATTDSAQADDAAATVDAATEDSGPDPCTASTCTDPHRTVCINDQGQARCDCDSGFVDYGDGACRPVDPCTPTPCTETHRAVCANLLGVARCSCDPGYVDPGSGTCQPALSCSPNPCTEPHKGECAVVGNQVQCSCDGGYVDDGNGTCVPSSGDACNPSPCTDTNRTRCSVVNAQAVCLCDVGYEEDGLGGCGAEVTDPCLASSCGTAISGRITHGGAPLSGMTVNAYDGACPLSGFVSSAVSDDNGYYVVTGVSGGSTVYLRAASGADARWWNAAGGTSTCLAREGVAVVDAQTTTDVDFVYPAGGAVAGRITASSSGVGPGFQIKFYRQLCGGGALSAEVFTDASGNYLARGLPVGSYYVEACATCQAGFESYANRWWTTGSGSSDCDLASTVSVSAHTLNPAVDVFLEAPASISGTITLDGSPVSGVLVHAYDATCAAGNYMDGAFSVSDGSYHLPNLPEGTIYLETRMRNLQSPRYADRWWNSSGGTYDCSQAEGTAVTSGSSHPGRDFTLQQGGSVSGQLTASSAAVEGMYVWAHVADCARSDDRAWFQPALTDASGDYQIPALPEGDVRIYVSAQAAYPGVVGWYDGSTGVASCVSSTLVHVTDQADTASIDLAF
ncbi:MAG: carboxypeptidase-like regulatory domain-containing protein [Pseudomonadota bacterium]